MIGGCSSSHLVPTRGWGWGWGWGWHATNDILRGRRPCHGICLALALPCLALCPPSPPQQPLHVNCQSRCDVTWGRKGLACGCREHLLPTAALGIGSCHAMPWPSHTSPCHSPVSCFLLPPPPCFRPPFAAGTRMRSNGSGALEFSLVSLSRNEFGRWVYATRCHLDSGNSSAYGLEDLASKIPTAPPPTSPSSHEHMML